MNNLTKFQTNAEEIIAYKAKEAVTEINELTRSLRSTFNLIDDKIRKIPEIVEQLERYNDRLTTIESVLKRFAVDEIEVGGKENATK